MAPMSEDGNSYAPNTDQSHALIATLAVRGVFQYWQPAQKLQISKRLVQPNPLHCCKTYIRVQHRRTVRASYCTQLSANFYTCCK